MKFLENFKQTWQNFPSEKKRKFVLLAVGIAIVAVSLLGYVVTRGGKPTEPTRVASKTEEVKLDTGILQKTQLAESQKQFEEMKKQIEELKAQKAEEAKKAEEEKLKREKEAQERMKMPPGMPPVGQVSPPPPVPPAPHAGTQPPQQIKPPEPPKPELIGGIGMVSGQSKEEKKEEKKTEETKKKTYYLPSSFMEATLLSGLDAPAVGKGESHPVPVLLRVKAPAVLPNKVKANLRGCFVIAEGVGNLASERVDLRLVSLSCIDRKGNAVIDQKVKGFVVDSDGKIGLRGRVVSKMGIHLARSLIAGIFGGLSNVAGTQAYSYTVTGSGTVSTLDAGKAAQAAVGAGISQAASELQKFYLDLARQTVPVIEVHATRTVTLVVSDGVELELKIYNLKD
ncbi:TraB/VirB10 family protein [Thermodesulfovibrio yellowstonii]|uniref:TraB/VirB10 family protein n=1 Tax=Thermodesulfovibrio yellowstonii TaxID=28262 RepID=UPI0003FB2C9D|nr:TraB/VirB10 family protein [Thermodesulfovibrio islandicus]